MSLVTRESALYEIRGADITLFRHRLFELFDRGARFSLRDARAAIDRSRVIVAAARHESREILLDELAKRRGSIAAGVFWETVSKPPELSRLLPIGSET